MPYPRKLLGPGEDIVLDFNPHWSFLIKPIGWTALWLIVLGALVWFLRNVEGALIKLLVVAAVIVGWMFTAGLDFIRWRLTEYVLTTDRLIVRSGIIAKQGREIPLENINDIAFSQSIFERMVGAGDLVIESAGEFGQSRYHDIPKPTVVQNEIYKQMEANRGRMMRGSVFGQEPPPIVVAPAAAPPPPPVVPPPVATPDPAAQATGGHPIARQIEELGRLRDQGLISESEFQTKKAELLRRM